MSRVDELIAELCPGGVPVSELSELASTVPGLTGKTKSDFSGGNARFASYRNIFANPSLNLDAEDFVKVGPDEKQNALRLGDILITGSSESLDEVGLSSVVTTEPPSPIYLNSFCFILRLRSPDMLEPGFAKHLFRSESIRKQIRATASGVTRINISKPRFMKVRIPVPPLEVQREIVRVLDQFTQLEAELEAELEARRRQYEHYRQRAMSFDDSIPRVALGDIAEVRSGWGFPNAHQGQEEGEYPFYKVSDMNLLGNETVMSIANHYVSAEVAKKLGVRPAPAGTVIFPKIGAAVATNKKRVLSVPSAYDNNVMGLVPTERVTSRFLYHWMQTFDLSRLANDSGAVPSIRKTEAEQVLIPLPDLDTQRKVADLLDKFDALVNDLNVGLPAELAARRKQYEYYRDNLLTFEEAAA